MGSSFLDYRKMHEENRDLPIGIAVANHDTPNGGVFSVAIFSDAKGRLVKSDDATNIEIHECDENGQSIYRTYGLMNSR